MKNELNFAMKILLTKVYILSHTTNEQELIIFMVLNTNTHIMSARMWQRIQEYEFNSQH